jgi:hypothetical protein
MIYNNIFVTVVYFLYFFIDFLKFVIFELNWKLKIYIKFFWVLLKLKLQVFIVSMLYYYYIFNLFAIKQTINLVIHIFKCYITLIND